MRNALIGILMAATAATPLAAQNYDNGRDRGRGGEQRQAQPQHQAQPQRAAPQAQRFQPQGQRQAWGGRNFQQQAPAQVQPQARGNWQGRGGTAFQGQNRFQGQRNYAPQQYQRNYAPQQYQRNYAPQQYQRNYAPQQGARFQGNRQEWRGNRGGAVNWNRSWRNDGRYNWQRYRYQNRGIFHLGPYYAPYRGYYYSPPDIGIVLDAPFYERNYWIDPAYYDLPGAPPGAEWVRYYNDVVLVDMDSGEVLDVIHDFFW